MEVLPLPVAVDFTEGELSILFIFSFNRSVSLLMPVPLMTARPYFVLCVTDSQLLPFHCPESPW